MAEVTYQRLGASVFTFGGILSLWLGEDHLLHVTAVLGNERYRRWYLREIQAVVVRRTSRRAIWNLVWGVLGGLALASAGGFFSLAASSAANDGQIPLYVAAGIFGTITAVCGAIVLWNSLLGPTCAVFLQTPAGLQLLTVPSRRRAADALFVRLRPLIEAAQLQDSHRTTA